MHELVYFARCLPWSIADALPGVFGRYKIQAQKTPSLLDQWVCTKYILMIHFLVELPLIITSHLFMRLCGIDFDAFSLPTYRAMSTQIASFFVIEDTYHYWIHRLMHWGPLYRSIHRIHHQYAAPFGLTAEYASPWETVLLGLGTICPPMLLGLATGSVHLLTILGWMTLRQIQAVDAHSGYDFPWSMRHWVPFWGGADWHDDHHRYFRGNYSSSFRYWDSKFRSVSPSLSSPLFVLLSCVAADRGVFHQNSPHGHSGWQGEAKLKKQKFILLVLYY